MIFHGREFEQLADPRRCRALRRVPWRIRQFPWRGAIATLVLFCCAFMAAGPAVSILLPVKVSESQSTEEESERTVTEEFCSRVPARRLVAQQSAGDFHHATIYLAHGVVQQTRPAIVDRPTNERDLDVKLGSGAPLRC
jgi:hypothetical protein